MKKWLLATTTDNVEWYEYSHDYVSKDKPIYSKSKVLRLSSTVIHGSKASAKEAAIKLGLKTWRYVVID